MNHLEPNWQQGIKITYDTNECNGTEHTHMYTKLYTHRCLSMRIRTDMTNRTSTIQMHKRLTHAKIQTDQNQSRDTYDTNSNTNVRICIQIKQAQTKQSILTETNAFNNTLTKVHLLINQHAMIYIRIHSNRHMHMQEKLE